MSSSGNFSTFSKFFRVFYGLSLFILTLSLNFLCPLISQALPVFPGARGFGTETPAGSGRHLATPNTTIFRVTTLADSGSGSLRACIDANVPRVCIFEVSGRISLLSDLFLRSPYITIAGQTAPAPGIMLTNASIRVVTHDVLIQHIQIRPGDQKPGSAYDNRDGIGFRPEAEDVYNIVIDHVSISWSIDENVGIWNPTPSAITRDLTFSNSIIAEGLFRSKSSSKFHSMGMLVGYYTQRLSVHHSLFAHNVKRNPFLESGTSVEFVDNIVFDWQGQLGSAVASVSVVDNINLPVSLNFIGNRYIPSPKSPLLPSLYGIPAHPETKVFVQDNLGPTRLTTAMSEWAITNLPESPHRSLSPVFPLSNVQFMPLTTNYEYVLTKAGARPLERKYDPVDTRIISEVRQGKAGVKDCITGCAYSVGGWPSLKVNKRTLSLPKNPSLDDNKNGYTNLEDWLFSFSKKVE